MKNFFKNLFKNKRPYPDRVNEDPAKPKDWDAKTVCCVFMPVRV